ncbi:PIN domain protein [Natrialba magadii ATCC 43099]|uniref:Nucleic acid-binding protein n=1 Tax=Natrialba magadii (strain ATCC 43099 / DSM 3394 / CCM 3739 / CIP 104546 / IAM 13178 / JCM 8861 / NBRC 102185 / NCIMB 2190 / MS3) TaxID=547559 RepID=D3T0J8_NATMM|nr:type II toxin-antitoxin system VapC family toxin [Natrialba magadii]ADD06477.1 PIN domain protein [Natrialba magadii ATCC 43099]ELY31635.1 nucleic acid-binding protein [Natrialba magadii ATCC 43099]
MTTATAVDTNALLALLYEDDYANASEAELRRAYRRGRLVITSVAYAELAADGHFDTTVELDRFLSDFSIQVVDPSQEALFQAGEGFQRYTERRPDGLQCPSCGTKQRIHCEECSNDLSPRQHIAADFVIGAHATVDADALLSFDTAFYETYYPSLTVYPE